MKLRQHVETKVVVIMDNAKYSSKIACSGMNATSNYAISHSHCLISFVSLRTIKIVYSSSDLRS